MGVYIKGMEMPECCGCCPIEYENYCMENYCMVKPYIEVEHANRHPRCPLIEVPEPHGRLIDADAFKRYCQIGMEDNADLFHDEYKAFAEALTSAFLQDIDEQLTIIPASEEG